MRFFHSSRWHLWATLVLSGFLEGALAETMVLTPTSNNIQPSANGVFILDNRGNDVRYHVFQGGRSIPWNKAVVSALSNALEWNITLNGVPHAAPANELATGTFELQLDPTRDSDIAFTYPTAEDHQDDELQLRSVTLSTEPLLNAPSSSTIVVISTLSQGTTSGSVSLPLRTGTTLPGTILPTSSSGDEFGAPTFRPPPASTYDTSSTGVPDILASTRASSGKIAGAILGALFGVAALIVALCMWRRRVIRRRTAPSTAYMAYQGAGVGVGGIGGGAAAAHMSRYPDAANYFSSVGDNSGVVASSPTYLGPGQRNRSFAAGGPTNGMPPVFEEKIQDPYDVQEPYTYPTFAPNPKVPANNNNNNNAAAAAMINGGGVWDGSGPTRPIPKTAGGMAGIGSGRRTPGNFV